MRYITSLVKGQPGHRKIFDNKIRCHREDEYGNKIFEKQEAEFIVRLLNSIPSVRTQPMGAYPMSKYFAFLTK